MNWWQRQSETTRWVLYLPTLIVVALLLTVLFRGLLTLSNWRIAGETFQNISAALVFASVSNKLSLWLAPRWKKRITVLVTSPVHLIALLSILNFAWATFGTWPTWAMQPASASEAAWSATWLATSFAVLAWHKQN